MKLDKDNLAKILSLWLHVEALTPFDLDKNDLIEQMPGSLNQPRSSLFTWDNEDTTQRDSLEIELQKLPKEEDRTDFFRMLRSASASLTATNSLIGQSIFSDPIYWIFRRICLTSALRSKERMTLSVWESCVQTISAKSAWGRLSRPTLCASWLT